MLQTVDGLQVKTWKDRKWLIIETANIDKYISYIESEEFSDFEGIIISRDLGYKYDNVDFLNRTPNVKSVSISDPIKDISGLYFIKNLVDLSLVGRGFELDLSRFPDLSGLSFDWHEGIKNLESSTGLKRLIIGSFNPKTRDFSALPSLRHLEDLEIIRSTVESLHGIERLPALTRLSLAYCPKLTEASEASSLPLNTLELESCKNIADLSFIERLTNLRLLRISKCGTIDSIKFINNLDELRSFSFVGTTIEDGDLTPCLRLAHVGFSDKKHYSHTYQEVQRILGWSHA